MSTLVAQTISNGTVSTSSANIIRGYVKASCAFAGTTGAILGTANNVSSVTRNTSADYTINFTTALPNADYAVAICTAMDSGGFTNYNSILAPNRSSAPTLKTTTQYRINTYADYYYNTVAFF